MLPLLQTGPHLPLPTLAIQAHMLRPNLATHPCTQVLNSLSFDPDQNLATLNFVTPDNLPEGAQSGAQSRSPPKPVAQGNHAE